MKKLNIVAMISFLAGICFIAAFILIYDTRLPVGHNRHKKACKTDGQKIKNRRSPKGCAAFCI